MATLPKFEYNEDGEIVPHVPGVVALASGLTSSVDAIKIDIQNPLDLIGKELSNYFNTNLPNIVIGVIGLLMVIIAILDIVV